MNKPVTIDAYDVARIREDFPAKGDPKMKDQVMQAVERGREDDKPRPEGDQPPPFVCHAGLCAPWYHETPTPVPGGAAAMLNAAFTSA